MVEFNKKIVAVIVAVLLIPIAAWSTGYSLEECQRKASAGEAEAQWQLGQRYEMGDGIKKNNVKAIAQYKKAAERKHPKACARLAEFYEKGIIVQKDPVLAAKYQALAKGESGERAAEAAREDVERKKIDEIEVALDYLLGRNGKQKDPAVGIRILYQSAKDKPVAQRVFVERWCHGDLNDAIEALSIKEIEKLRPWFEDAWKRGDKRVGVLLGNLAYDDKEYYKALAYWQACDSAKGWYQIGHFYGDWKEEDGGASSDMKDETKARKALERCIKLDWKFDIAKYELGIIYLFGDKSENLNYTRAKELFANLVRRYPDDKLANYYYGMAGIIILEAQFDRKWPKRKVEELVAWYKEYSNRRKYGETRYEPKLDIWNRMCKDWDAAKREKEKYIPYIKKAASLGCEAAKEELSKIEK